MRFTRSFALRTEVNSTWHMQRRWPNLQSAKFAPGGGSAAAKTRRMYCHPAARRIQGFKVERLDHRDRQSGALNRLLVEDRKVGPAETAVARLDMADWFGTLTKRNRKIATALALGEPTAAAAKKFGISPGRISQLRNWLQRDWERFHRGSHSVGSAA